MAAPRTEKAYEKHAWILLFAIGVFYLLGAITHIAGQAVTDVDFGTAAEYASGECSQQERRPCSGVAVQKEDFSGIQSARPIILGLRPRSSSVNSAMKGRTDTM